MDRFRSARAPGCGDAVTSADNRRPIASRSARWARGAAAWLARIGVSANAISVSSLVFAALAAAALVTAPGLGAGLYLAAAVLVPLRLVANLLDGMVAIEHGRASATGPLYNEVPDRIADVLVLVAFGASAALAAEPGGFQVVRDWGVLLGALAAIAALLTAYVRELGRGLGMPADFCGPFAKQQRMGAVVVGALLGVVEPLWGGAGEAIFGVLCVIAAGTTLTVLRRLNRLAASLRTAP